MLGCSAQWYSTVPLCRTTYAQRPFVAIVPESHLPSRAVAVCGTISPFDQRTVSPTATLTLAGANWNPVMFTRGDRGAACLAPESNPMRGSAVAPHANACEARD